MAMQASGATRDRDAEQAHLIEEAVAARTRDLTAALEQRTALLHEADHRIKNSLQVVASLLLLKARRLDDPNGRAALNAIADRVGALSTVHRLLHAAPEAGRFDVSELVRELAQERMAGLDPERVRLELDLEPVEAPAAKGTPLTLILHEIVANAAQHAFPGERRGTVRIAVRRQEADLSVIVEDDGIGLPGGERPREGFGMMLIELLAKQLKARVEWRDAQSGTRIAVTLPLGDGAS